MFTGPLFEIKLYLWSTVLHSGFQSSLGVWNPLSKAVPGKFDGFGGYNILNCLQDSQFSQASGMAYRPNFLHCYCLMNMFLLQSHSVILSCVKSFENSISIHLFKDYPHINSMRPIHSAHYFRNIILSRMDIILKIQYWTVFYGWS